jgi:CubicO group peptidase (beta-lactamase class C family)
MRYQHLTSLAVVVALLAGAGTKASAEKIRDPQTVPPGVSGTNCPKIAKSVGPTHLNAEEKALARRLTEEVQRQVKDGFSGAVLIAKDSSILIDGAYGTLKGQAISPGARFLLASAAKQFTSASVLRLQDKGKLRLDEPLGDIFPSAPPDKRAITVRQLLSHSSGLAQAYESEAASNWQEAAEKIFAEPLTAPPGSKFQYSNENYQLSVAIVESLSGTRYDEFLHREFFAPAQLNDTGRVEKPVEQLKLAPTLSPVPSRLADSKFGGFGYFTTAEDFYRWFTLLRQGCVLSRKSTEELFSPVIPISEGAAALGWFVGSAANGAKLIFTRGNDDFGQNSLLYYYPESSSMIIVLTHGGQKDGNLSYSRAVHAALERILLGIGGNAQTNDGTPHAKP